MAKKFKVNETMELVTPMGSDVGNPPNGYVSTKDVDEDAGQFDGTVTALDVFNDFQGVLESAGIRMQPSLTGLWAGFNLYVESKLNFTGLTTPANHRYLRKLEPSVDADLQIVSTVLDQNQPSSEKPKYYKQLWYSLVESITVKQQNKTSRLYEIGVGRANQAYNLKVSLMGRSGANKVVPLHKWFPESVRNIDPNDLLRILPEPERKAFMLSLGRAMVGARGESSIEGVNLDHTFRAFIMLVGYDPGLGKSWLMNDAVVPAMRLLGYEVVGLSQDLNQFGFAKPSVADLVFIDDMTKKSQTKLLGSAELKTMISNGELQINEKYIPICQVRTRSVLLGCTNHFSYADYIEMDSGLIDRVNATATVRKTELVFDEFDYRPKSYWTALANELGVSLELIAAWLLRCCVDYFMEVTGYDADWQYDPTANKLETVYDALRKEYRIDVDLTHVSELIKAVVRAMACALATTDYDAINMNMALAKELPLSWAVVWEYVKFGCKFGDWHKPHFKPIACPSMAWSTISEAVLSKSAEVALRARTQTSAQIFSWLASELQSKRGFGFPKNPSYYSHLYEQEILGLEGLVDKFRHLIEKGYDYRIGGVFKEMVTQYHTILARASQLDLGKNIKVVDDQDCDF